MFHQLIEFNQFVSIYLTIFTFKIHFLNGASDSFLKLLSRIHTYFLK